MKIKTKAILILIMILVMISSFNINIYAEPDEGDVDTSIDGIVSRADDFLEKGTMQKTMPEEAIKNMSNTVYNTLFIVGIIASFVMGIILAIKFITSSLEEKANVKQMLVPYIIGMAVLFGAFTIWKIVLNILQN